eukprot:12883448-Alexandrium_andersonii.AAC.1
MGAVPIYPGYHEKRGFAGESSVLAAACDERRAPGPPSRYATSPCRRNTQAGSASTRSWLMS